EGRVTFYLLSLPPHPALGQFSVGFGDDCHTLPLPFSPTGCGRGRFILHFAFCDEGRVTFYLFYYGCLASYTSSVCSASTFPSR
ncbi:MAG: hypothetical protein IJ445_02750, partial [Clostridia bacterium]|nr:hypothetical protein [Clostridia bacterium]